MSLNDRKNKYVKMLFALPASVSMVISTIPNVAFSEGYGGSLDSSSGDLVVSEENSVRDGSIFLADKIIVQSGAALPRPDTALSTDSLDLRLGTWKILCVSEGIWATTSDVECELRVIISVYGDLDTEKIAVKVRDNGNRDTIYFHGAKSGFAKANLDIDYWGDAKWDFTNFAGTPGASAPGGMGRSEIRAQTPFGRLRLGELRSPSETPPPSGGRGITVEATVWDVNNNSFKTVNAGGLKKEILDFFANIFFQFSPEFFGGVWGFFASFLKGMYEDSIFRFKVVK